MAKLSVVIPTHKRPHILKQCLEHLAKQTVAKDLEVIVVSDGHDEETARMLRKASGNWQLAIGYFEITKSHQGVARNEGVKHATSEHVLFIGDDIFLGSGTCEKHLATHQNQKLIANSQQLIAILGFVTWDPACGITDVMRWLEQSGWQFGYPSLERFSHHFLPPSIQHKYTYTSHVSLPTDLAKEFPFQANLSLYGWEDIEWGMRLRDAGVKLFYEPDARALHHHHVDLPYSLQRMEILGRSAREMETRVPDFDRVPRGFKLLAYKLLSLLPTTEGQHRAAFLKGLNSR